MGFLPPSLITLMEAVVASETSANFYKTARRRIPEDSHLHRRLVPLYVVLDMRAVSLTVSLFIAFMMEAVHTSETSVNFNVTTRRYIPEDSKLHTRRRENLKSHILNDVSENHTN
jgi:hypothetical protein